MEFKKYPSLINHYDKEVEQLLLHFPTLPCQVQEKLHGANFGVYLGNTLETTQFAARNGFLAPNQKFMGLLEEDYALIYQRVVDQGFSAGHIIHGELIGQGIQKGIRYCNDKRFVPFSTLPVETMPLADAFAYDVERPSAYGLAHGFDDPENTMEGIVITPQYQDIDSDFSHSLNIVRHRINIKKKGIKWKERASKRKVKTQPTDKLSAEEKACMAHLSTFITENRLHAVFSKAPYTKTDFGKLRQDFIQDALAEAQVTTLSPNVEKALKTLSGKMLGSFYQKHFM